MGSWQEGEGVVCSVLFLCSLFLVLGAWCLGAWCLVLGAWCFVLGAWCLVLIQVDSLAKNEERRTMHQERAFLNNLLGTLGTVANQSAYRLAGL